MRACALSIVAGFLWVSSASAQQMVYYKISAGTGFFINKEGHLVTNAHVVRNCESINVLTKSGERPATLVNSDTEHDLAVLRVMDMGDASVAPMRWNIRDLKVGDSVNMIGFPGQDGAKGKYSYKKTKVTSLEGPTGEPLFIQLSSVAQHGNSGGPVLDNTGNVIAVISGMAQTYRVSANGKPEDKPLSQTDVAITLTNLQDFLRRNSIPFYESLSSGGYGERAIEENALRFTVPVRCIQGKA